MIEETNNKVTKNEASSSKKKSISLFDLESSKYKIIAPIDVKIEIDKTEISGSVQKLGLYAFGETESEVISEIQEDIIDLFEELSELSSAQLGLKPRNWKDFLTRHIELVNGD